VGVIGGLGGWVCPVIFGYLIEWTGIWTTCWMFFLLLAGACFLWMHVVVRRILKKEDPAALHLVEHGHRPDEPRPVPTEVTS
jgi:NNP family nitrate/nitrite transporter-like MFS transporter